MKIPLAIKGEILLAMMAAGAGAYLLYKAFGLGGKAFEVLKDGAANFRDTASASIEGLRNDGADAVTGIGDVIGVPSVELSRCQQALTDGDIWSVSLYCDAPTYLAAQWNQLRGRPLADNNFPTYLKKS